MTNFTLAKRSRAAREGEYSLLMLVDGEAVVAGTIDVSADASEPGPEEASSRMWCLKGRSWRVERCRERWGRSAVTDSAASGRNGNSVFRGHGWVRRRERQIAPLKGGLWRRRQRLDERRTRCCARLAVAVRSRLRPRVSLVVSGVVRGAGGGGGDGTAPGVGGGGGGAGGAILLESDAVPSRPARACAPNVGSGGEGRDPPRIQQVWEPRARVTPTPGHDSRLGSEWRNGGIGGAATSTRRRLTAKRGLMDSGGGGGAAAAATADSCPRRDHARDPDRAVVTPEPVP